MFLLSREKCVVVNRDANTEPVVRRKVSVHGGSQKSVCVQRAMFILTWTDKHLLYKGALSQRSLARGFEEYKHISHLQSLNCMAKNKQRGKLILIRAHSFPARKVDSHSDEEDIYKIFNTCCFLHVCRFLHAETKLVMAITSFPVSLVSLSIRVWVLTTSIAPHCGSPQSVGSVRASRSRNYVPHRQRSLWPADDATNPIKHEDKDTLSHCASGAPHHVRLRPRPVALALPRGPWRR